jgi:hypothetical protein
MDYGLGLISDILSFFNPMKILTGQALENAQTSRNLRNANTSSKMFGNAVHFGVDRYQQQEHYNMGRAGILGTSSNFISNPFIANYGVNEIDENGDIKLFNTYCVKLPDYVEKQISAEYLINGYACDIYQNYIEYDNNILTNKIKIASGDNSYIINILNHPVDEYNNIYCKNEFCNLLNNGIILIKKDELINDYIPISYNNCFRNVQINKIPVPLNKTYIGNFILESDTSKIQKIETYPINKNGDFTDEAKQLMNFVDDLGVYGIDYEIEHDLVNAMFTINILEANKKYYGNITRKSGLFYFMQPHELFITRDDLYINRLKNILSNKIEPINQMYCNVNEISITNLIDKICVKMHNKKNLDEFFLFDNCICLDNYSGKKWFN